MCFIIHSIFRMPDASGSEMSTSMNSDASCDIDIVRHHDVATSTANLLDASDSDSESECDEDISRYGKQKNVSRGCGCNIKSYFTS